MSAGYRKKGGKIMIVSEKDFLELEKKENKLKSYSLLYAKDLLKIKNLINKYPRESYDWYINQNNNFVTFFFNQLRLSPITFNGITLEVLTKLFQQCNVEFGSNLFQKEVRK